MDDTTDWPCALRGSAAQRAAQVPEFTRMATGDAVPLRIVERIKDVVRDYHKAAAPALALKRRPPQASRWINQVTKLLETHDPQSAGAYAGVAPVIFWGWYFGLYNELPPEGEKVLRG